ncbi:MAG: HAD-IA family hydrolase [Bacteroidota bacterium]|nr:HAD-IA family hydrolase [Bacteroidota bacterium]
MTLLFDFDQVLVDTVRISGLRTARDWATYRRELAQLRPVDGISELLTLSKARGHKLAIVTQSPGFAPTLFARKENWPIDAIVGWHGYRRRKPDPKCLLVALRKLQATPAESYHIGDLPADTEAARRAGIGAIAAAWAAPDKAALRASRPDHFFETVEELSEFIADL